MDRKVELLTKSANCLGASGWTIEEVRDYWVKCMGDEVVMRTTFSKMRNGGNQVVENIIDYCRSNFKEPWLNKMDNNDLDKVLPIAKDILLKLISNKDMVLLDKETQDLLSDVSVCLAKRLIQKAKEV